MTRLPKEIHERAGAVFSATGDDAVPRSYGDPAEEYSAAVGSVAVCDRGGRGLLAVTGRAPVQTLNGVLTGSMPRPPGPSPQGGLRGRLEYSAVLNPKGRVIAEVRTMWGPSPEEESLWMDVPALAMDPLLAHLKRYVPPRLAALEDVSGDAGLITVLGAGAGALLRELLLSQGGSDDSQGAVDDEGALEPLEEGEYLAFEDGSVRVAPTGEVDTPAWDVFASNERRRSLWSLLVERGARPVGAGVWNTLRVEAGRPTYGRDMDESVILSEVGIVDRAVDHSKGCYTGQEVIVRIRDRGHVNRILRGLRLGDGPAPGAGAEVFFEGSVVGHVTSVADSPRSGGGIALGYVRQAVPPGEPVNVGAADGPAATVRELAPGWART